MLLKQTIFECYKGFAAKPFKLMKFGAIRQISEGLGGKLTCEVFQLANRQAKLFPNWRKLKDGTASQI